MKRDDVKLWRGLILGLVGTTTAAATLRLWAIFEVDGLSTVETLLLLLFALLFSWIATSFWIACLGALVLWRGVADLPLQSVGPVRPPSAPPSRTVLAMPIYNEEWAEVFARLQAMQDSLRAASALDRFDLFILSDSTDPAHRAAEQTGWRDLRDRNPDAHIYYRHRTRNVGRKSGNIADLCKNWGALYEYMVVLDADSLMTAATLTRLVDIMDANPRTALIQVAPMLVGGESLFARSQQFASWVYGRVYAAGLAKLQGPDGNYWGHNAIIRVAPFMQHCGLPVLPGRPPLGGEIMSHDFVEAALLRRAGWDVWLTTELGGSYEAPPPTLIDHLKRDRRWCQGNLQHVKLLFAEGIPAPSRLHFAFGAMSYLSSPLWLMLIVLFFSYAVQLEHAKPVTYVGRYPVLSWPISHTVTFVGLVLATAVLLYAPKFIAAVLVLRDAGRARAYGGVRGVLTSLLAESTLSTLLAPVMMLSHSWFVLSALVGRSVGWGSQKRGGSGVDLRDSFVAFAPHTAVATAAGALAWYWTPATFWWYLPLLSGLVVAIVLCWFTSNPARGLAARRRGLFLVPSESVGLPILRHVDAILADPRTNLAVPENGVDNGTLQTA